VPGARKENLSRDVELTAKLRSDAQKQVRAGEAELSRQETNGMMVGPFHELLTFNRRRDAEGICVAVWIDNPSPSWARSAGSARHENSGHQGKTAQFHKIRVVKGPYRRGKLCVVCSSSSTASKPESEFSCDVICLKNNARDDVAKGLSGLQSLQVRVAH
jgi:hypothetical protein